MTIVWVVAGVVALSFVTGLEFAARHYGVPGPLTQQARELIFAPASGPLLYAAMALMMVVLTRRERLIALGAAVTVDLAFWAVRWALGAAMNFGNGALWVMVGVTVIALTRREGAERVLLLKGVGLGLLLVAGRKTGDAWLLITSKTKPTVLDPYLATADHALGNPSWVAGQVLEAVGPVGSHLLDWVYVQLAVAAVVIALYQLRNVAGNRRFPRHHLVRTFLVIGLLGPGIYMIFPVVGPVFAYGVDGGIWAAGQMWPHIPVKLTAPQPVLFDQITPRNCMPSLHTAWATALFIHSRQGPRLLRFAGTFWLVATLCATLGFGYHYGVDLVSGVVFVLTIEAALRAQAHGWDRPALRLAAYGAVVFTGLLLMYRFRAVAMSQYPALFGLLILAAMGSVIYGYIRVSKRWEQASLPTPRRPMTPQPEAAAVP
ncbi:phosphatase PAP2 family protein [Streptomyces indicus]|uniref:PAP2 superfamily protein n=1 Tax=Streptomyces indicus TaxID=417292 RepID=A0A1G8UBQ6_9ACTN|nr:phosphatase PAP2 family protein [Streptomyces indicus]SDJ51266.1 PAP2 superfamily protein [Streptomyces indicus]